MGRRLFDGEVLAKFGVDYVQGYIVAMPQASDAILVAHSAASFITDPGLLRFLASRGVGWEIWRL